MSVLVVIGFLIGIACIVYQQLGIGLLVLFFTAIVALLLKNAKIRKP